jgi:glycosyltransferase involved in cell wall biosynthesis
MKIVVGATAAGHKSRVASKWLSHAEAMRQVTPHELTFFLAAEVQPDGLEPRLEGAAARVKALGGEIWKFMIDDGTDRITNQTRLIRICEGRNLITEFALRSRAEWVLFVDADIVIPPDTIIKLLEIRRPFCGFKVASYCLSGAPVPGYSFPVEVYQNTAGAWFLHHSLFRFFRWLWDPYDNLTDDPATYRIIRDQLRCEQHNRCDLIGLHDPLVPFETRDIDADLRRNPLVDHPITAVIPVYFPTAEHVEITEAVLQKVLEEAIARVYVIDNGGVEPFVSKAAAMLDDYAVQQGDHLRTIRAPGKNIYEMWNLGWKMALADFGDEVLIAFLNNDIDFRPRTLEVLARAVLRNEIWVTYPDPGCRVADGVRLTGRTRATRGSKRHGGMTGHCFLIKGGIHTKAGFPLFDVRYQSWYGDDDFAFRINKYGFEIHCVEGLPCDHLNEATMRHRSDLVSQREADHSLFVAQWGISEVV